MKDGGENFHGFNKSQRPRSSLVINDLRVKGKHKLPSSLVHDRSKQDTDVYA